MWQGRLELAAPVDCIDIDAERVLAERIGRCRRFGCDGEDTRPVRYARLAAALKGGFGPFDLERFIRRAHDAGNLNRHGPLADICERICRPRVVAEILAATLGGEVIRRKPVPAHQHRVERHRPDVFDEFGQMPGYLRIGRAVASLGLRHRSGFAEAVDLDDIGHDAALQRLPDERARHCGRNRKRAERHQPPVAGLHTRRADALVP